MSQGKNRRVRTAARTSGTERPSLLRTGEFSGYVFLAFALLLAVTVRVRLINLPLERDEGEYAYAGQLMLQGIPPYQLAYNMKLPGVYAAYAGIMGLFGETIAGIHTGVLLVNVATIVLLFLLGRRLMDSRAGGVAAASYALLSVSPSMLGLAGHATHFVVLPVVLGALLLLRAIEDKKDWPLLWIGALFGLALLMKQPGAAFALFAGCYLIYSDWRARLPLRKITWRSGLLALGIVTPFALTCLWLTWAGVFGQFWFWTVQYASKYGSIISLSDGWTIFSQNIVEVIGINWPLWVFAAVGLCVLGWNKNTRRHTVFITALLAFSFLSVCPGYYFRPHYFILMLPAVALLVGIAVSGATESLQSVRPFLKWGPSGLFAIAVGYCIWSQTSLLFETSPTLAARQVYGVNPFPESIKIADYLRSNTVDTETIAILGSEPQIYFYSRRHSATGYIYAYGLMERQPYALQMQQEMIRQIEAAKPAYLLYVNIPTSWLASSNSENLIFEWAEGYVQKHMEQVGFADILSPTVTEYHLGDWEGKSLQPRSEFSMTLFKRKTGS